MPSKIKEVKRMDEYICECDNHFWVEHAKTPSYCPLCGKQPYLNESDIKIEQPETVKGLKQTIKTLIDD